MSMTTAISRRRFLSTAANAGLVGAISVPFYLGPNRARAADGLAEGMVGGPTGFDGAERYQYGPDTPGSPCDRGRQGGSRGQAMRRTASYSACPTDRSGQLTQPFPAGAPSIKELWEAETGITLDIVGVPNGQEFTKVMQDVSTKGGAFDIYAVEWNRLGDLAETGGIVNLDEYVAAHRPEWDHPERGYVGGEQGVSLLNNYRGSTYGVSLDGDFQIWNHRTDLFSDPAEQKAFADKHGYELAPPKTWKQHDEVAAFFHRPDQGLFGSTDLRNQGWGYTNWYQRFVSMASPNQFLFSDDGSALINSEAGISATQEYCGFAGASFAGCDLLGLARAVWQFRLRRRGHDLRLLQPAEIPGQSRQ